MIIITEWMDSKHSMDSKDSKDSTEPDAKRMRQTEFEMSNTPNATLNASNDPYVTIGILDLGPRICKNMLIAADDGPLYTEVARALELASASDKLLDQCSTHRHVYRAWFPTSDDMNTFIDNMSDFMLVDSLSATECLLIAMARNTPNQIVIPGRSMYTSSVHDTHTGQYYHFTDPKLYQDVAKYSKSIYDAGALEVLLVVRFEPRLSGVYVPSPDMIDDRLATWADRESYTKILSGSNGIEK